MTPASRLASWTAFHLSTEDQLKLAFQEWRRTPDPRSLMLRLRRIAWQLEQHLDNARVGP